MAQYCFRTVAPGGDIMAEVSKSVVDMHEAISQGMRIARETKNGSAPGSASETWLVDVLDPWGGWAVGLPVAMVSREPQKRC